MTTFTKVRHQIGYDPCDRRSRKASGAQLDYLAQLIIECEGQPGFRWDYSQPEAFTSHRALVLTESLKRNFRK